MPSLQRSATTSYLIQDTRSIARHGFSPRFIRPLKTTIMPLATKVALLLTLWISRIRTHPLRMALHHHNYTRNRSTPTEIITVFRNDTPSATITLFITPRDPLESIVSITHTLPNPSTITFLPEIDPPITLTAILSFPFVGTIDFSITARTTNPNFIYTSTFRAITAGVAITQNNTQVSGPSGSGVSLGSYRNWINIRQVALPLTLESPFQSAPVDLHPRLTTLNGSEPSAKTSVDAVDPGVCTISLPQDASASPNTMFIYKDTHVSKRGVIFPSECSLAVSDDFNWLLIRLNPYRVAQFGFGVSIQWRGPRSPPEIARFFPMQTFVRITFDPIIPPIIISNFTVTLDPFGGELLEIPIQNSLSPPQVSDLAAEDFVLRLQVVASHQVVTFLRPEKVNPIDGSPHARALIFRTKPLRAEPQLVQFALLGGKQEKIPAVIYPEDSVDFSLASDDLAVLDSCYYNEIEYKDAFLLVEIGMRDNQSTFTLFKSNQIKGYISGFFAWIGIDGVRLVEVGKGKIRFAVLLSPAINDSALNMSTEKLEDSIVNGSFAMAINSWEEDVTSHNVRNVRKALCEEFPHLLAGSVNAGVDGLQFRLLLLWVFLVITVLFISIIVVCMTAFAKKQISPDNTSDEVKIEEVPTEAEGVSSSCSYPLEARETFAKRYHMEGTLSHDNVRDSDLASTVVSETASGLTGIVTFVAQLGRDIGTSLGQRCMRLRMNEWESGGSSPPNLSESQTPPIRIEHTSYNSTETFLLE